MIITALCTLLGSTSIFRDLRHRAKSIELQALNILPRPSYVHLNATSVLPLLLFIHLQTHISTHHFLFFIFAFLFLLLFFIYIYLFSKTQLRHHRRHSPGPFLTLLLDHHHLPLPMCAPSCLQGLRSDYRFHYDPERLKAVCHISGRFISAFTGSCSFLNSIPIAFPCSIFLILINIHTPVLHQTLVLQRLQWQCDGALGPSPYEKRRGDQRNERYIPSRTRSRK